MKTKAKLTKKPAKRPTRTIRPHRVKQKTSNTPIIIISITIFIVIMFVIIAASTGGSKKTPVETAANTDIKNDKEEPKVTPKPKAKPEAKPEKLTAKKSTPETEQEVEVKEVVIASPKFAKPEDQTEETADQPVEKQDANEVAADESEMKKEAPKKMKEEDENLPEDPKERSIYILKKIGREYKAYADTHQGHMPIELYQLELNQSDLVSPLTKKKYFMEQDGKGTMLKESLDLVIVREADAVNGKYICLFGNGTVKEIDAATINGN